MSDAIPLVSVVIPTYERKELLREAITSVLAQSLGDFELIVVDNASRDDPESVIRSFADPRIRYHRQPENIGQFRNYLSAFALARGRYVASLGDDDRWRPDFLAKLVPFLEADPTAVLAFCDHDMIDGAGAVDTGMTDRTTHRHRRDHLAAGRHDQFDRLALLDRAIYPTLASVLRRDALDWSAMPRGVVLGFDLCLGYLAARTGRPCWYVPERLAQCRFHTASISAAIGKPENRIKNSEGAIRYWEHFMADPALPRYRSYYRMKRDYHALKVSLDLLRHGGLGEAKARIAAFAKAGYLEPSMFFWHAVYAARLGRANV